MLVPRPTRRTTRGIFLGMFECARGICTVDLAPRPETVESLFLAHRLTGDPKYRRWGWNIFQAIEKHCKVPTGGYATVLNVDKLPVQWDDKQETFLLASRRK